jgi:apolipoprotein N-acyltransferase
MPSARLVAAEGVRAPRWLALAAAVRQLAGWRRHGLSFVLGLFAVLALPPLYAVPALLVSFTGLLWLIEGARSWRSAVVLGWWFGFGYFVAGLYWIAYALLTDPERFGWMVPFAVGGLSAYFSVFPALAVLAAYLTRARGAWGAAVLAGAWTVGEWLRGIVLTGFAWNPVGSTWVAIEPVLQLAAVIGVYGLSLLTVLAAASPAAIQPGRRPTYALLAACLAFLVAVAAVGANRLANAAADRVVAGITLRLVQPNIEQTNKWREDLRLAQLTKFLELSRSAGNPPPTDVIWPETAMPYFLAQEPRLRRVLADVVPPGGALITGSLRSTGPSEIPPRLWNSLHALDAAGTVTATYDKFHLVPFGEFMPLRSVIGIAKLTQGGVDFSAGPGPQTLTLPGLPPFSPLICYEVIFPGEVVAAGDRPRWLLNVTNDAWFGISSGPHQHFSSARLRAVEEGLPLVRAANTGISGIIDAYGRVIAVLGLGRQGIVDGPLPQPAVESTWFSRFGNTPVLAVSCAIILLGLLSRFRDGRREDSSKY